MGSRIAQDNRFNNQGWMERPLRPSFTRPRDTTTRLAETVLKSRSRVSSFKRGRTYDSRGVQGGNNVVRVNRCFVSISMISSISRQMARITSQYQGCKASLGSTGMGSVSNILNIASCLLDRELAREAYNMYHSSYSTLKKRKTVPA